MKHEERQKSPCRNKAKPKGNVVGALSYDLAHGTTLEMIFVQFLNTVRMAPTLAEVNVAAGLAHDAVNALATVIPVP